MEVLSNSSISENVFDAYEEDMVNSRNKIEEWIKEIKEADGEDISK